MLLRRLPGAAAFAAVGGLASGGGFGLVSVKLLGRIGGEDANLAAILDDDFRMATISGDVSDDGDEFAVEVGEIADRFAVVGTDKDVK